MQLLTVPVVGMLVGGCISKPPPPAQTVTQTVTAGTEAPSETTAPETTPTTAPPAPQGQEVRDGNLAFSVDYAFAVINGESSELDVSAWARNVGARPATFNAEYQTLVDNQGRAYSVYRASHEPPDGQLEDWGGVRSQSRAEGERRSILPRARKYRAVADGFP
jgi:hypothetical protein